MTWKEQINDDGSIVIFDDNGECRGHFLNTKMLAAHMCFALQYIEQLNAAKQSLLEELAEELEESVRQGASWCDDGTWDSCGLSTYANQMHRLAELGRAEIVGEPVGRRVFIRFKDDVQNT